MWIEFVGLISKIYGSIIMLSISLIQLLFLLMKSPFIPILREFRANPLASARIVSVISWFVTFILFFTSAFFSSLATKYKWGTVIFALLCAIPLYPLPRPMNIDEINPYVLAILKSKASFFGFFFFNWVGSLVKVEQSWAMIISSLSFAIFLICMDYIYEVDELMEITDGYIFAGFGLMLQQILVPTWAVYIVGVGLCFLKEILKILKKRPNNQELRSENDGNQNSSYVIDIKNLSEGRVKSIQKTAAAYYNTKQY